jgi:peroxiredoxin
MKITRNNFIEYFSKRGNTFRFWHWIIVFPKLFPRVLQRQKRKELRQNFLRQQRSISLDEDLNLPNLCYPKIQILVVVAGKDIEILDLAITSALSNSMNQVSKVTIVCPTIDLEACARKVKKISLDVPAEILDENKVISADLRKLIRKKFSSRYGWILQQVLAVDQIFKAKEKGVLLLNADTILLRPVHWLDCNSNQILMVGTNYHQPYYDLLGQLLSFPLYPKYTFVTHHMLIQPILLKSILKNRGYDSSSKFFIDVLNFADEKSASPICIEFEPYAQGMLADNPEKVLLRKFSNLDMVRNQQNL